MNTNNTDEKMAKPELPIAKDECPDYVIIRSRNIDGTPVKFSHKQTVKKAYKAMIKGQYPYISILKRESFGKNTFHWIWNPAHDIDRETYEDLKCRYEDKLTFTQIVDIYLVMTGYRPGCLVTSEDTVEDWPKSLKLCNNRSVASRLKVYYTDSSKQPCVCTKAKHFYYLCLDNDSSLESNAKGTAEAIVTDEIFMQANEHVARGQFLGYPYPIDISKMNDRETVVATVQCNKYVFSCFMPDHLNARSIRYLFSNIIYGLSHIFVEQPRITISNYIRGMPPSQIIKSKDVTDFITSIGHLAMK